MKVYQNILKHDMQCYFAVQEKTDKMIAQELQEKEKVISAEREKKEFQQLQVS